MTRLKNIVAAENIPYVDEAFGSFGHIRHFPGRTISQADLQDTNILLIRSITQVNETLLRDTSVEFVGSASAGIDHIDKQYLSKRNIGWASAAGSNANSVAEYVIAALLYLGAQYDCRLEGKTIGIIGVGNIGKLVQAKAGALGMRPVLHDPPLADAGLITSQSLEDTLACDFVTLHTPLTTDGHYPTYHLLNKDTLQGLGPSTALINAARGEVVDTEALRDAIRRQRIGPVILDVWEQEPYINWDLVNATTLATPHIAGHSLDGKANGTLMLYSALCKHLGIIPSWNPATCLPKPTVPTVSVRLNTLSDQEQTRKILHTIYNIEEDCQRMRQLSRVDSNEAARGFDLLRKNYPIRREWHKTKVKLPKRSRNLKKVLHRLGIIEIEELD